MKKRKDRRQRWHFKSPDGDSRRLNKSNGAASERAAGRKRETPNEIEARWKAGNREKKRRERAQYRSSYSDRGIRNRGFWLLFRERERDAGRGDAGENRNLSRPFSQIALVNVVPLSRSWHEENRDTRRHRSSTRARSDPL